MYVPVGVGPLVGIGMRVCFDNDDSPQESAQYSLCGKRAARAPFIRGFASPSTLVARSVRFTAFFVIWVAPGSFGAPPHFSRFAIASRCLLASPLWLPVTPTFSTTAASSGF